MNKNTASAVNRPDAPRIIVAGGLPAEIASQLQVVDAKSGERIAGVIDADTVAGTVRRYEVEDGNLVRKDDSFSIIDEERSIRIEWIEATDGERTRS